MKLAITYIFNGNGNGAIFMALSVLGVLLAWLYIRAVRRNDNKKILESAYKTLLKIRGDYFALIAIKKDNNRSSKRRFNDAQIHLRQSIRRGVVFHKDQKPFTVEPSDLPTKTVSEDDWCHARCHSKASCLLLRAGYDDERHESEVVYWVGDVLNAYLSILSMRIEENKDLALIHNHAITNNKFESMIDSISNLLEDCPYTIKTLKNAPTA